MKTKKIMICMVLILGCYCQTISLTAQQHENEVIPPVRLNGPRIGFTYIAEGEYADYLKNELNVNPFIAQFGWQFETRFFTLPSGVSGLVEGIVLLGGLEQNMVLPSGTFLIGLRSAKGIEFGFGPSISLSGVAFVFAAGVTLKYSNINFPINIAVVPTPKGIRLSLLVGFNANRR